MDPLGWLAKVGLLTLCVIGVTACGAREARVDYAPWSVNDPRQSAYRIGVSDVIRVTVWKDPSLSTDTTVRPDGKITVPLVGELEAGGRTAAEVQEQLVRRLAAFVKDAIVTVAVVEVNSYRFTVAGNVERPGMFTPRYYVTVSEAIALAGGPNRFGSTGETVVIRPRMGAPPVRIPIDYDRILSGELPQADIVIRPGDTVLIP